MLEDLDNWDLIPLESYKDMYTEAKERYSEFAAQSESITNRSIQMIAANTAVIAWFANFISNYELEGLKVYLGFLMIAILAVFVLIIFIIFPRKNVLKGTAPSDALKNELDFSGDVGGDNYTHEQKIKVYFYHQVLRYHGRINSYKKKNSLRIKLYKWSLRFSFFLFCYVIIGMVIIVF